jgi:uncharacterized protein
MNNQQKNKEKHVPVRTCIGTGEKHPKKDFIRIVNVKQETVEGVKETVQIDLRDKLNGRGANLLPSIEALEKAFKNHGFQRAFKRKLRDEEIEYLRSNFPKAIEEKNFRPTNKPVVLRVRKEEIES